MPCLGIKNEKKEGLRTRPATQMDYDLSKTAGLAHC